MINVDCMFNICNVLNVCIQAFDAKCGIAVSKHVFLTVECFVGFRTQYFRSCQVYCGVDVVGLYRSFWVTCVSFFPGILCCRTDSTVSFFFIFYVRCKSACVSADEIQKNRFRL
jgi:hypothetical protein